MFDRPYLQAIGPKPKRRRSEQGAQAWDATRDALVAILVTDLAGFTPLVLRLGDVAAQRVIRTHNRVLRACLASYAGDEIAHTGDGVIATFRSVARALTCAREIQNALRRYNRAHSRARLRVRIGVHAGEPLPEDGRLFGTCVNTAVRICSATAAGHVLVSDLVWRLAAGRSFAFQLRGAVALKGLREPLDLYELSCGARGARMRD
jgi:adenylate cyclase